jgi:hypothetical protein
VGVISGVGNPAKLDDMPLEEVEEVEEDLYRILLRRVDLSVEEAGINGLSLMGMLTLREGREGGGDVDLDFVMTFVMFVESSMMLDDAERARDLRPGRGLGVREGVGSPFTAVTKFSGARDKGRRLRFAGR